MQYSPFKTKESLLKNFDKIGDKCGTYICIYNLFYNSNEESEFEFTDYDILMNELKVEYGRKWDFYWFFKLIIGITLMIIKPFLNVILLLTFFLT